MFVNGSGGNDANDGLSWANAKLTIGNATGTVSDNGVVTIAEGVYSGANNTNILIDRNMTINGLTQNGVVIDGTDTYWIFHIISGTVIFNNLTLVNGTNDRGGAINNGGTLTLNNCTFIENSASLYGGAIYSGDLLTVTNCKFNNNTAGQKGGAIYATGNLTVSGSTFIGNKAMTASGGAIHNDGYTLNITDSIFTSNQAEGPGGAIYTPEMTTVSCGSFSSNHAYDGGAIFSDATNLTVTGTVFTSNTATNSGGAILNNMGNLTLINPMFSLNHAEYGGAFYNCGGNVTVNAGTFTNNTANSYGGAIGNDGTEATLILNGGTFTGNNATSQNGGAIYNGATLNATGTNFTENKASNSAGAIYNDLILTVTTSNFTQNLAFSAGAIFNSINGVLTVTESNFIRNMATYEAGAIMNLGYQQNIGIANIIGNNFIGNTANLWAGAISNYGNLTANFNRIINNTAPTATDIHGDADRGFINSLYNWWGSNSGPEINSLVNVDQFNPWLVLTFTANPTTIPQGATSTLMADFRYDSANGFHDPSLGHLPDDTPVTFSTTLGNVGSKSVDKLTLNGIAKASLRADEAAGDAIASVLVDYQPLTRTVTITPLNAASTTTIAGKTVGMQKTGVPIGPLALAVLSVLGILVSTRKKQ